MSKKRGHWDCDTLSYILSTGKSAEVENMVAFLNQIVRSSRLRFNEFVDLDNYKSVCYFVYATVSYVPIKGFA